VSPESVQQRATCVVFPDRGTPSIPGFRAADELAQRIGGRRRRRDHHLAQIGGKQLEDLWRQVIGERIDGAVEHCDVRKLAVLLLAEHGDRAAGLVAHVKVATRLFGQHGDRHGDPLTDTQLGEQLVREAEVDRDPPPRLLLRQQLDRLHAAVDPARGVREQPRAGHAGGQQWRQFRLKLVAHQRSRAK
jgi:hypothetical protein